MERAKMRAKCSYRLAASTASGKHERRLPGLQTGRNGEAKAAGPS